MEFRLQDFLLVQYDFIDDFINALEPYAIFIISVFFLLAILYEVLANGDVAGILQRVFLAILTTTFFATFHKTMVDQSFNIANSIAEQLKDSTLIFKGLGDAMDTVIDAQEVPSKSLWQFIKYHLLFFKDYNLIIATILLIVANGCLIVATSVYTIGYYLGYVLVAIPAALSIFPMFKFSLGNAFKATVWCMVMPFVVLFITFCLGHGILDSSHAGKLIGETIEGTVLLLTFSIFLALSGAISWGFISTSGITQAASIGGGFVGGQIVKWGMNKTLNMASVTGRATGFSLNVGNKLKNFKKHSSPLINQNKSLLKDK